jgi:hypothetical protein
MLVSFCQTFIYVLLKGFITNLACDELIMKFMQSLLIHRFVHFTHEYHAFQTCLAHK